MVIWIIIIVVMAIFQVVSVVAGLPDSYVYVSTILIFVSALGFVYKCYSNLKKQDTDSDRMEEF